MGYKAPVNEIFTSIQGEGLTIGVKQLFIRFGGCNLSCKYCDTNHSTSIFGVVDSDELFTKIYNNDIENLHSIALTGGEPLLHYKFLKEFLPKVKELGHKIYLETNGTLENELSHVGEFIDFMAMDIKIDSSSKQGDLINKHRKFLKCAKCFEMGIFAKVVFNKGITEFEIINSALLAKEFNLPLVIQPEMSGNVVEMSQIELLEILNKFLKVYPNTRLIAQMHKFLDIE